ncbi:MAG: adenylate kinase family protein [Nanoarchaeota archaeon]
MRKHNNSDKILIVITGSPGVGKSTLAKFLVKKIKLERLDLHHHYKRISVGYNHSKQSYDVDYDKFEKLVKEKLQQSKHGLIIDSHISHLLPKKMVDLCIVLICSDLKKLEKRLKARKYSKKKIRENLDAEIFQVCLAEAKEKRHKIIVFDTAKMMDQQKIITEVNKLL